MALRNVILALLWLAVPADAAIDYITSFANILDEMVWPTPNSDASNVSSTFGPRIRASCNCDDFHRGTDIHGAIGDPVVASYGGKVVKLSYTQSGGNTVVIEHLFADWTALHPDLPNTKKWNTLYLHMNSYNVTLNQIVTAGQRIGELGATGAALAPHLHHEVRVGTRCSLEWAVNNPSSRCNTKGYDPHVSPFLIYPGTAVSDIAVSLTHPMDGSVDGIVHVETPDTIPNVNKYTIEVIDTTTLPDNTVVQSHTLDLNLRIGYDPTSTVALDIFDFSKPYLAPISFGFSATKWGIDLVVPAGWLPSKTDGEKVVVTVTDIWGLPHSIVLADDTVAW